MKSFKVPYQNAQAEYVEKKSRFIGHIFKVETPEQATGLLKDLQKQYWEASHNVYAYVLENGVMRFSDGGEPQGTAGMPTLEVLKKEEVFNVLCVTIRYFGGTLLGAGGLTRAYGHTCKLALDAAGQAVMQPFLLARLDCPYPMLEQLRRALPDWNAEETGAEYASSVLLDVALPSQDFPAFEAGVVDFSRGSVRPKRLEEKLIAKKIK